MGNPNETAWGQGRLYSIHLDRLYETQAEFYEIEKETYDGMETTKQIIAATEDCYEGDDAEVLRTKGKQFIETKVEAIRQKIEETARILKEAYPRYVFTKVYCQHFIDVLNGNSNGAVMEETTTGMMKADVERIEYIKEKCTKVCGETYDIRRGLAVMDGMLSTLRFSTFDGTSYMDAIRRDTYKIDRLEDYSFGLTRYLEMVVDTDEDTNLQFLRKLNEYEELHPGEAGAITYNPINELIEKELMGEIEDYWNQGEEYFGENWWADENKKQEAFNILLLEASISGQETGGLDLMAFLSEAPYGTTKREAFMLLFQMIPDSDNDSIMPELISGACSRYGIDLPGNGWVVPYEVLVYHTLNHEEIQKMCDQNGKEVVSYTLNFFPIIGEIKSALEAIKGKDLIAGTELSAAERVIGVAGGFLDVLSVAEAVKPLRGSLKFGSKAGKIDDIVDSTGHMGGSVVDDVLEDGSGSKIYSPVEYEGTVKVNGEARDVSRKVYQRNDIDFNYFDETTGLTNLERMQAGKPPIGTDGNAIQLHHVLQKEVGPMVEIREVTHQEYYSQLHGLIEDGASFRNDPVLNKQYNNFRRSYWKWRAEQITGGK